MRGGDGATTEMYNRARLRARERRERIVDRWPVGGVEEERRDPIRRVREPMIAAGMLTEAQVDALDAAAVARVKQAVARARSAPYPQAQVVDRHLFASSRHER